MARITNYSYGRQWYAGRDEKSLAEGRKPFTFIVLGRGYNERNKLCYLWLHPDHRQGDQTWSHSRQRSSYRTHNTVSEYGRKHLTKYGQLLDEILDPLAFEVGGLKFRATLDLHADGHRYHFDVFDEAGKITQSGDFNRDYRYGVELPGGNWDSHMNVVEALQEWLTVLFGEKVQLAILRDDFVAGPR